MQRLRAARLLARAPTWTSALTLARVRAHTTGPPTSTSPPPPPPPPAPSAAVGATEVPEARTPAGEQRESAVAHTDNTSAQSLEATEPEPVRWVQTPYEDPSTAPIVDEKGEYIVSKVQWPTGDIAYTTPPPVDDKLAPRFGYNVVQVKKHVSWWKYNQKYPRLSLAYINIQLLFLLGLAWLGAFLTTEHRRTTEAMKTPGAMVGEHRGRGPVTNKTQKVTFSTNEMSEMVDRAQNNWLDGSAEANYIGSKDYRMKKIPRPKEFSVDDFRKR